MWLRQATLQMVSDNDFPPPTQRCCIVTLGPYDRDERLWRILRPGAMMDVRGGQGLSGRREAIEPCSGCEQGDERG